MVIILLRLKGILNLNVDFLQIKNRNIIKQLIGYIPGYKKSKM